MRPTSGRAAVAILWAYQRYISPVLTPRCRYWPTCSEYARQAIERGGLIRGGWAGLGRLLRCQPLGSGGIDLPR